MSKTATVSTKQFTYADGQALRILVGKELGFTVSTCDLAEQQLSGKSVSPMMMSRLDAEATGVHNLIADDERNVERANEIAKKLLRDYGFEK